MMLEYLNTELFLMCYTPNKMPVKVASYKISERLFALKICLQRHTDVNDSQAVFVEYRRRRGMTDVVLNQFTLESLSCYLSKRHPDKPQKNLCKEIVLPGFDGTCVLGVSENAQTN